MSSELFRYRGVMTSVAEGIELYRRGRTHEAIAYCRSRLLQNEDDADALGLLGEIYIAAGEAARAVPMLERLGRLLPHEAAVHRQLAGALLSLGRSREAEGALRRAIALEPHHPRAHNHLGQALWDLERRAEAVAAYREALRLEPGYAAAHNNLGRALAAQGDLDGAIAAFERARDLDPALLAADFNLAATLADARRGPEALQAYDRVLARAPDRSETWAARAAVLAQLNRHAEALPSLERALALRGEADPVLWTQQAWLLLALDRAADALHCADRALRLDPALATAHNARAGALRRLGRHAAALDALAAAVHLDPQSIDAWCNRGKLLHESGDTGAAIAAYERALAIAPRHLQTRTRLLARLIPAVPDSCAADQDARARFDAELCALEAWLDGNVLSLTDALTAAQQQFFYLSYEAQNHRDVLVRYRGAAAERLARFAALPRWRGTEAQPHSARGRLRLGIAGAQIYDHSVYHAIVRGWLLGLDRTQFEIHVFSLGLKDDAMTQEARAAAAHFHAGSRSVQDWAETIRRCDLDALIYPELGMDEATLGLAAMRLAGAQFAAWGHPETSGFPTIDGYLSGDLLEPPDAADHYAERLHRLPNLGVWVERYALVPEAIDWAQLLPRVPLTARKFICPGVPFKYRPQHDGVWVEIARRVPDSVFVFFCHEVPALSQRLAARLAAAFRTAGLDPERHLAMLPWQPRGGFFGVLAAADVYLDTIGFSGFNTLLQAVECHLPCVTMEGRFLRGRLGSGILRRLGMPDLIADDAAGYVARAVRLATDAAHHADVKARLRAAEPRVYRDRAVIAALATVLRHAHRT